ncbi:hypothetical protein GcM3_062034, partial [Golovinomyces cichoracearum]
PTNILTDSLSDESDSEPGEASILDTPIYSSPPSFSAPLSSSPVISSDPEIAVASPLNSEQWSSGGAEIATSSSPQNFSPNPEITSSIEEISTIRRSRRKRNPILPRSAWNPNLRVL